MMKESPKSNSPTKETGKTAKNSELFIQVEESLNLQNPKIKNAARYLQKKTQSQKAK